jgi:uncharacterized protein YbjT (DUF2867 family)
MLVIAGVTGHVGSVAARRLLARNAKIKVIVRDASKGSAWSKQGAEVATGELGDKDFLSGALRGASGFFALLPPPPFTVTDFYGWQRKTGETIAGAVTASGVPHVVLLSSVGAHLASGTGPIKGLHHLENALRATGAKVTAIRAGYFQENVGNAIGAARGAGIYPNFMASADVEVPMIATKDIGALVAETLASPPAKSEVVDIQGPAYSPRQIAEKLGAALGKTIQLVDIPQPGWLPALTQAGMPPPFAEAYAEMFSGFASGNIRPVGDRLVHGETKVDEVIAALVRG